MNKWISKRGIWDKTWFKIWKRFLDIFSLHNYSTALAFCKLFSHCFRGRGYCTISSLFWPQRSALCVISFPKDLKSRRTKSWTAYHHFQTLYPWRFSSLFFWHFYCKVYGPSTCLYLCKIVLLKCSLLLGILGRGVK